MNWLRRLLQKKQVEQQLDAELRDHFERQVADNIRAGMSEAEARRSARLQFGGLEQVKEECRDARGTRWVESVVQDVRYTLRTLGKSPGFTITAVCTLALGIGANTAIFSVINGVILRPLPYKDPNRLLAVDERPVAFSYPDFLDCTSQSRSFEKIAAWRNVGMNLTSPGEPEYIRTRAVSAAFFPVLGIEPILGRGFLPEEDRLGRAPVAIISYSFWQRRFSGHTDAIGKSVVLYGKSFTVIGVLPANFQFRGEPPVYTLISQDERIAQKRDLRPGIKAIARMRPDITLEQVNTDLKVIGQRLAREYPATNSKMTFGAEPLEQQVIGDIGPTLYLLAGGIGLVLLIACANVANLFLARSLSRSREFAVRAALGAGRGRLIRQLLTESTLLSFLGGAAGLAIAAMGTRWALHHLPFGLPRAEEISLDGRALFFTALVSMFTGIVSGLVPVFRRQANLENRLKQGARGTSLGVHRLQSCFVAAELALALVLLTGAGLMIRTLLQLWAVNPGFDPRSVLVMDLSLSPNALHQPEQIRNAWRQTLERVRNTPGVEAAALDSLTPMSGDNQAIAYWTSASDTAPPNAPLARLFTPMPGYLQTMKIPLVRGRFFTDQDTVGKEPVVVIDEVFANKVFPKENPVGRGLSFQFMGRARIVGVVGSITHFSLDEDASGPRQPTFYLPFLQIPDQLMPMTVSGTSLLVRTSVNPASVMQAVKQSVLGPGRDQPVRGVTTMEQMVGDSIGRQRGMMLLLSIFAGLALTLAAIGIYGVISYSMNQRVQEMGIRMALGAQPAQVLRLILGQGMRMALVGLLAGLAASFALTRLMKKLLYGVSPNDPLTFVAVVLMIFLVALIASYLPARRASRIDPMVALRYE